MTTRNAEYTATAGEDAWTVTWDETSESWDVWQNGAAYCECYDCFSDACDAADVYAVECQAELDESELCDARDEIHDLLAECDDLELLAKIKAMLS